VQAGRPGEVAAGQREDGVGHVVGQHLALEQGPLGVELAQVLLLDPVDRGAGGTPAAGEDARPAHDAVGVDAVDPDLVRTELGGQQANLVGLVGLGGAVGDVVRPGEQRVLAGDVDDVAAHPLLDHDPGRLAGDQEAALGHDVVLQVPVALGGLQQRLGDGQASVVDHQVDPAKGQRRLLERRGHLGFVGDVDGHRHGDVGAAQLGGDLGRGSSV
jgi:hypothetical protein